MVTCSSGKGVESKVTPAAWGYLPVKIDSQQPGNYQYDAIGNLTRDYNEDISNIDWTVQGKVASISKSDNTHIAFTYDAQGNRTSKTVTLPGGLVTTTYYVRDAQGNVMSVYEGTRESASWGGTGHDHVITLSEQPIYGSSRIGLRLGNGLEVKRINFPLSGDPQVVSNGNYTYTDLGQLISANISNEGAFITDAKAMPGISASLKAIAEDTYSLSFFTDNANPYGNLEYKLLQDNTNPVWEGETATTGSWSHTLTAGSKNGRISQPWTSAKRSERQLNCPKSIITQSVLICNRSRFIPSPLAFLQFYQ